MVWPASRWTRRGIISARSLTVGPGRLTFRMSCSYGIVLVCNKCSYVSISHCRNLVQNASNEKHLALAANRRQAVSNCVADVENNACPNVLGVLQLFSLK